MSELLRTVTSQEYWFVSIFTAIVVAMVANKLNDLLSTLHTDAWLRIALTANAVALPILGATGYGPFTGSRVIDLMIGTALAGIYWAAAQTPVTGFRLFAFFAPNLSVVALATLADLHGVGRLWPTLMAIYPIVCTFFVFPIFIWNVVIVRHCEPCDTAHQ